MGKNFSKFVPVVGGTSVRIDQRVLFGGTHGRVLDVLRMRYLRPDHIKMFVLDEADEMLSRGFKDQVRSSSCSPVSVSRSCELDKG